VLFVKKITLPPKILGCNQEYIARSDPFLGKEGSEEVE
jgi:hypothetical protein